MVFKWEEKYQNYFRDNFPKNEGMYDYLTEEQEIAIKDYFKWRTRTKFNYLTSYQNLKISENKAKELIHIIGHARDWVYDGVVDLGAMHGKCTLGHALRYEHHAVSKMSGKHVVFGVKCASDFFDVSTDVLKKMDKVREETFEDIKRVLYVHYTGLNREYVKLYTYDFPKPLLSNGLGDAFQNFIGEEASIILYNIILSGLPIPLDFVRKITKFRRESEMHKASMELMAHLTEREAIIYRELINTKDFGDKYYIVKLAKTMLKNNYTIKDIKLTKDILNLVDVVMTNRSEVEKIYKYLNLDNIYNYSTVYFIKSGNINKPAYLNEIQRGHPLLKKEYLCYLETNDWSSVMALVYAKHGSLKSLRACYPKARNPQINISNLEIIQGVGAKIYKGIEYVKNHDLLEELDAFSIYKENVIEVNNTVNDTVSTVEDIDLKERVWQYLHEHKGEVSYRLVLDILNKYNDVNKLSEKQYKVLFDVYNRLSKVPQNNIVKKNEPKVEEKQPLRHTQDMERLIVIADDNGKRCCLIATNDACKVISARKFLPYAITDMMEMYNQLVNNPKIVCNNNKSLEIIQRVQKLYNKDDNTKAINPNYQKLSDYKTDDGVDFDNLKLREYTRNVFKEEGCIDTFLQESTLKFLDYRKKIRS